MKVVGMEGEDIKRETVNQNAHTDGQGDEMEKCKEQAERALRMYAYLSADFDNYKKRVEKERAQWIDQAVDGVLVDVLPLMDDIDRGLADRRPESQLDLHTQGLELIAKGFSKILAQYSVEEIPFRKEFDPQLFEAIMQVPSEQ